MNLTHAGKKHNKDLCWCRFHLKLQHKKNIIRPNGIGTGYSQSAQFTGFYGAFTCFMPLSSLVFFPYTAVRRVMKNMNVIDNTEFDDSIVRLQFACNLRACKGACCTLHGGTGAPLLDEEIRTIEESFPLVKKYLPAEHLRTIERVGLYEGSPGTYTTVCIDHRACVFVFYEDGIAHCAFERAHHDGILSWYKPISCHLFPLRLDRFFTDHLRYEKIDECAPALERGRNERIALSDFLSEPLKRIYGTDWYERFASFCRPAQPEPAQPEPTQPEPTQTEPSRFQPSRLKPSRRENELNCSGRQTI
jgi:hypothetical protein